jgi:hypothetical protein
VRKRLLVRKLGTHDRGAKWKQHESAVKIQAVWRGHVARKWLEEIEKDAEVMVQQIEAAESTADKSSSSKDGEAQTEDIFQPRPILDFLDNVIAPSATNEETESEPDEARSNINSRIRNLESLAKSQKKQLTSLEKSITVR